jgi:glycosyltransferase involved in cell wall biosynthesis
MLKILIIIPSLKTDGVTNSTLLYLENMDRRNMDICVGVASQEGNLESQINRIKAMNIPIKFFPPRHKETLKYCSELKKYLENNPRDIIHVMGNSATMAVEMTVAKNCNVPIRICHVRSTQCKYKLSNKLLKPLLYRNSTNFFACGKEAGKYLYGDRNFIIAPNGKNINKFLFDSNKRLEVRNEISASKKTVIGHIGMFVEAKNHRFLINMFARLCKMSNNYELWLVGSGGEMENDIHSLVNDYGLNDNVKFLGFRTDVDKILSAIDLFVFPSIYEGLPNVVIEAQMAGLPCVLSDRISDECKVMDNVMFLSLDDGIEKWCDVIKNVDINDRNQGQDVIKRKMSDAGYDIKRNAEMLKKTYMELLGRAK